MRRAVLFILVAGCKLYFGDPEEEDTPDASTPTFPDASVVIDAPSGGTCAENRPNDCSVDIGGTVVDFVSRAPYAGMAEIEVTTGWDTIPPFPLGCPPLQVVTTDGVGAFTVTDAICDSPLFPPVLLLMVSGGAGETRAPTATDSRLTCSGNDCGVWSGEIRVPSTMLATTLRQQLQAEGMPNATTRGLVIFEFRDLAGNPQAGVTPFYREGTVDRPLVAPREVRFISGTRDTLVRSDATMTGTSGLAVIAIDGATSGFIGGTRSGGMRWEPVGVLFADGWIFLEDKTQSP
jgi:hypothetical protein